MQAPELASFLSIVDKYLYPVPLCDLDQVLLKEVMAENRGLTLSDLKNRSPEHLCATLTGCESPDDYLEPAAVKEDADDQLSEIASTIPPVYPSCVDLKHSAFLAQLLLEEVDLVLWLVSWELDCASCFSKIPKYDKPLLRRIFRRGTNNNTISKT